MVEKGLPFEEINVDLGNKPKHFSEAYASIAMDPEGRAAAPILEVGKPGEPGYVRLVESEVVARYLVDAFPDPPMKPSDPARCAEGNMFVTTFMGLVASSYNLILAAKTQEDVDKAWKGIRRGLFAVEVGLKRYRTGEPFFGERFGLVEALCAPFVIRMLCNVKKHRGVDMMEMQDLPLSLSWMAAIRAYPSVVETSPEEKSLCKIQPYLEPFFKATVSPEVRLAKPSTAADAEAKFAAAIDAGLVHNGKAPRDRSATVASHSKL